MLGFFFGPPLLEANGFAQGVLRCYCSKSLALGQEIETQIKLPDGSKAPAVVCLVQKDRGNYSARVVGPESTIDLLNQHFLPEANRQIGEMHYKADPSDGTHHMRTYAIRSPRFPNFKAVTVDVTVHGAMVLLDGSVEVGIVVPVELDLDDTDLESLKFSAKVEWCRQRDDKVWVAQLEFLDMRPQQQDTLKTFLADLKNRAPGSRTVL